MAYNLFLVLAVFLMTKLKTAAAVFLVFVRRDVTLHEAQRVMAHRTPSAASSAVRRTLSGGAVGDARGSAASVHSLTQCCWRRRPLQRRPRPNHRRRDLHRNRILRGKRRERRQDEPRRAVQRQLYRERDRELLQRRPEAVAP